MSERDWLDALVSSADYWAGELKEDHDNEIALCNLNKAIEAIHYVGEIAESKIG